MIRLSLLVQTKSVYEVQITHQYKHGQRKFKASFALCLNSVGNLSAINYTLELGGRLSKLWYNPFSLPINCNIHWTHLSFPVLFLRFLNSVYSFKKNYLTITRYLPTYYFR